MKIFFPSLFLVLILFSSCDKAVIQKSTHHQQIMDTTFEIIVYSSFDAARTKVVVGQTFDLLRDIEKQYSSWIPGTLTYRLNHEHSVSLNKEDYYILSLSQEIGELTGGLFDISVLPLMGVWGFRDKLYKVPTEEEIRQAKLRVDIKNNLILTPHKAELKNQAMLDLGGILKGYAVDKAIDFLKKKGFSAGIVNAGGNLKTFGLKPGNKPWIIGIRHPRVKDKLFASYQLTPGMAIATSGDYERFFMLDGVRYHHIMDPVSGRPVSNTVVSVSIIHKSTLMTDALATALFVMGIEQGLEFAEDNKLPVLFLYEQDNKIRMTNSSYWDVRKMSIIK